MSFMQNNTFFSSISRTSFGFFVLALIATLTLGCEEDPFYFTYDYSDAPNLPDVSEAIETINYDDGLVVYIMERGTGTRILVLPNHQSLYG